MESKIKTRIVLQLLTFGHPAVDNCPTIANTVSRRQFMFIRWIQFNITEIKSHIDQHLARFVDPKSMDIYFGVTD